MGFYFTTEKELKDFLKSNNITGAKAESFLSSFKNMKKRKDEYLKKLKNIKNYNQIKNIKITDAQEIYFSSNVWDRSYYRKILLEETFKPGLECVEVGVLKGDFSEILLSYNPKKLTLIDSWVCSEISGDKIYALEKGKLPQKDFDEDEKIVREKFKNDKRVQIIKAYSRDAVKKFKNESLDWVYIDTTHYYKAVLADLNNWMPKIKKGGYLCGDDFMIKDQHAFGVIEAVHAFLNLDELTLNSDNITHKKYGELKYKVIGQQYYIHKKL